MPTLAREIVVQNMRGKDSSPKLKFKGFCVGNPYVNPYSGDCALHRISLSSCACADRDIVVTGVVWTVQECQLWWKQLGDIS